MMSLPKFLTTVTSFSKILAAILFISLPFAGFYLGYKYQQQFTKYLESRANVDQYILKTQPSATQSASTANWKTYTNPQVSYSFKYPNDWNLQKNCNNAAAKDHVDYECIMSPDFVKSTDESIQKGGLIVVGVLKSNPSYKLSCSVGSKMSSTITCIEGTFKSLVSTSGLDSTTGEKDKATLRYLNFDTDSYVFTIAANNSPESSTAVSNIFDQILSTFQFTQ